MNKTYLVISLILLSSFYSQSFPKQEWDQMSEKELLSHGFKVDSLSKAWRYIKDQTPATGMMVIIKGKVSIYFGDIHETSYVASVRKSILAMMYGKYVDNGTIKLDQTLKDLKIDDVQGLSESEKHASILNLITARSGIYHPASNSGDDTRHAPKRGEQRPGEYYLYNNWDFNAAGAIFEKLTQQDIYRAFMNDLAVPLNMQDFDLDQQKKAEI